MNPVTVLAWIPVVREVVVGIMCLVEKGRQRRARRRAARRK